MVRSSVWTESECDTLLHRHRLSPEELAGLLPGRGAGAIELMRDAVHAFHAGGGLRLSRICRRRLEENRGSLTCATCGSPF